jgi:methyltransferase family protein
MIKSCEMDFGNSDLARKLAEQHCNRGDSDCRWYHGNWELLKSLGVVTTSGVHATELGALLELALDERTSVPRILLSGSTDATLLQILALTCGDSGRRADITAVDICATPLELMNRYARNNKLRFSSVRADILEHCPETNYDIIFTHAFMGNFGEAGRARLVRKWASMLSEGGTVVTAQRVRPPDSPPVVRFSADQSRDFVSAALEAAAQVEELQPSDLARVEAAATAFTEHFMSYAITSKAALERLFLDAGLTFRHLEYHSLAKSNNLAGPSVPSGGEYAFVIAGKENSL